MLRVLVRGSGDIGSAVAYRVFQSGYEVVIHDSPEPATTRRRMSFTDAVFDGRAKLDGVEAQFIKRLYLLRGTLVSHQVIPIVVKDFYELRKYFIPLFSWMPVCGNITTRSPAGLAERPSVFLLHRGETTTLLSKRTGVNRLGKSSNTARRIHYKVNRVKLTDTRVTDTCMLPSLAHFTLRFK